jgi:hypothetical protein
LASFCKKSFIDIFAMPDLHNKKSCLAFTALRRRSELIARRVADLTSGKDGQGIILLRQSKTDQAREGVLLALDIQTSLEVKTWITLAENREDYLLMGINGKQLNQSMDPGQISHIFNSFAG